MKPLILLTGKTGQIGSELLRLLPQLGEVVAPDRGQMDLSKAGEICRAIQEIRPHLIVNAAAYTAVDQAEKDEETAREINTDAPGVLAKEARKIGASMVHYSTDYVFNGKKRTPYEETDPANPINVYGITKFAGEEAIREVGVPHLIFRTAWVYSTRGRNFLLTILRLAAERNELRIVSDQIGAPTCASDIATATLKILTEVPQRISRGFSLSKASGTYHMTAAGETTWYDFATAILKEVSQTSRQPPWLTAAIRGSPMATRRIIPITTEEYHAPAPRPSYSVLSNARLLQAFGIRLQEWRVQLHRCFAA